jgi:hypothetical protein
VRKRGNRFLRRNDPHTKKRQGQFPAASVPGAPHFSGSSHFFWPMPFFLANAVFSGQRRFFWPTPFFLANAVFSGQRRFNRDRRTGRG